MEQLNFHRLWIFLQVIECGGFSAAAAKLYMSQPSVSNQVRQLETSLGAPLVDRSGAYATPTAEGEVLAEYARRLFLLADEAITAVRQVQGLGRGKLHIGGTSTVGTYLLPELLARFHQDHPNIDCGLFVGNAEQVAERLLAGQIALAVFAGEPTSAAIRSEPILPDQPVVVTAPGHPLIGAPVAPHQLVGEHFILREKGSSTRRMQDAALIAWDLRLASTIEMWGMETVKQAVQSGLGVSLVSEHTVARELADGRLAVLAVEPASPARTIVAAHRKDRLLAPAEQAFLTILRALRHWPDETPTT
ncbi:DNA-binding transcriptional regulator, LysR family [Actinokineospora alba]|uniref:DNA-binding transcriptional regulator, LysR family n=1 Tax=Actinokineospora alba TaxID=504798 RepID=A0A1H0W233_9PSEU|nr:DNA-binding transcriptional LysR family regulator [Actinokineospora alba]SDI71844.1 DNA-binding transcriptional regulator, LysR family [Actinokineospora alba]SDP84762.1 DNA-binding transcriptional regulator, LysR family [Actinokineospora alba]